MLSTKSINVSVFHFALFVTLVVTQITSAQNDSDWTALRGNNGYGFVNTDGILSKTSNVELKTKWKRKLGSGYSSVVVAGERLVTMYTDGTDDFVVCLNASDGETIWQTKTNSMFKGENGSFNGPISTPLIYKDKVYAFSAVGEFYCLALENGEKAWSRNFPKETGVKKPLYGFVTSPIVVENSILLQVGTQSETNDQSLVAMDPESGDIRWTVGDDRIDSQSPSVMNLQGRTIVLAAGGKKLIGVDPTDGKMLFEFPHKGGNGSSVMPVPIGNDQVLLTHDDRFSKSVVLRPQDDNKVNASEQWEETSIKNTYNMPVLTGGGVFAYSTRILTCVDPATGKAFWKTRKPGDGFLISVDGHLIINTKKGSLHLAKASTKGYEEIAGIPLFEDLVWSVPAYSNNAVFVRSLGEIARVELVGTEESKTIDETIAMPLGPKFKSFLDSIEAANTNEAKALIVDQWVKDQTEFPTTENDVVHFVYRGNQPDVALAGDFFGARQEKRMTRVEGTDLHYHSMKLQPDQRANYCFLVDFKPTPDPLNKRVMTSSMYAGEMEFAVRLRESAPLKMSWFGMPKWKQPAYLDPSENLAGKLVARTIKIEPTKRDKNDNAEQGGDAKPKPSPDIELEIYLPPQYEKDEQTSFPVVYIYDGDGAKKYGSLVEAFDHMFQIEELNAPPAIVVFLNGGGPAFTETLAEKIVPLVDKDFRTKPDRESRLVVGCGFSGTSALVTTGAKNELFGNVAVQSPLAFAAEEKAILSTMSGVETPTKVHIQWGSFDMFNPHENWDIRDGSKKIYESLSKVENLNVTGGMVNDSTDWSSWRNRYHEMLQLLN